MVFIKHTNNNKIKNNKYYRNETKEGFKVGFMLEKSNSNQKEAHMRKAVKVYKLTDLYGAQRVFQYRKREAEITKMMHTGYSKSYIIFLRQKNWRQLTAGGERKSAHGVVCFAESIDRAA